tara:strand:- start:1168 stop:1665 length:498 start_codon:yes stop_codon:yes gene_type:complete
MDEWCYAENINWASSDQTLSGEQGKGLMRVKKIHHVNFLVNDIEAGIRQYSNFLGLDGFIREELPQRGVSTARVAIGEQWLVLVQPNDADGTAGRHLAKNGEGFFLISYAVDSLQEASARVLEHGGKMVVPNPRQGLNNWHVHDIDVRHTMGAQLQFCWEGSEKR